MRKHKPGKAKHEAGTPRHVSAPKDYSVYLILFSLLLTAVALLPLLNAEFINLDDEDYVVNNLLIRSLSNIGEMFTVPVEGSYNPLTILSFAVNYAISGLHPWSYHVLNIILHLLNIFLVYKLAARLSGNNNIISFTTALLFGIHPMHVMSVAWVTERKDVLYTFFFLLGLLSYLKYADTNSRKAFVLSVVWFLLSLASKPAAIIFPLALFPVDYLRKRKFNLKLLAEKIPYVLFSIPFALLTFHAQESAGAILESESLTVGTRILYSTYGYMKYFYRAIYPVGISAYRPQPPVNEELPLEYILSPLFFLATVGLCIYSWKKYPAVVFGFAFFFINLVLVLKFIVFSSSITSNRFTYIPYIGLSFMFGWLLDKYFSPNKSPAYFILFIAGIALAFLTYQRAVIWQTSATLWDDAIKKIPSARAYTLRAMVYRKEGKIEKALSYYSEALKLNIKSHGALAARANIYADMGNDSLALMDYNRALSISPDNATALAGRGTVYARQGKGEIALKDLNRALQLNPELEGVYLNRGFTYMDMKQYENASQDFEMYLSYHPSHADCNYDLGVCHQSLGKHDRAVNYFTKAIEINPKPAWYLARSYSWNALGKTKEAREDALRAKQGGVVIPAEYASTLGIGE